MFVFKKWLPIFLLVYVAIWPFSIALCNTRYIIHCPAELHLIPPYISNLFLIILPTLMIILTITAENYLCKLPSACKIAHLGQYFLYYTFMFHFRALVLTVWAVWMVFFYLNNLRNCSYCQYNCFEASCGRTV